MFALGKIIKRRQSGFALIEAIVSLGILGFVAVAFLSALGTGAGGSKITMEQATAESLARSELEYVKSQPYQTYCPPPCDPPVINYPVDPSLAITASWQVPPPAIQPVDADNPGIQSVTVIVRRNGKQILSLTEYKVNRP